MEFFFIPVSQKLTGMYSTFYCERTTPKGSSSYINNPRSLLYQINNPRAALDLVKFGEDN